MHLCVCSLYWGNQTLTSSVHVNSQCKVEMVLPIAIGDYTDFFSSMHHAKNCGTIFRGPQNPINPNWYVDNWDCGRLTFCSANYAFDFKYLKQFQVSSTNCISWAGFVHCHLWNRYYTAKVRKFQFFFFFKSVYSSSLSKQ